MNFVVVGTDHRMQNSEAGFEGLLRGLAEMNFFEPLEAIAEECAENIDSSIGQRLARERSLRWYNLDMTTAEKFAAGILEEQRGRPILSESIAFRVPSDTIREKAWTQKLATSGFRTSLVICGYLHFASLVSMLLREGHAVDRRVYLETVPEIKCIGG